MKIGEFSQLGLGVDSGENTVCMRRFAPWWRINLEIMSEIKHFMVNPSRGNMDKCTKKQQIELERIHCQSNM